MPTYEYRCTEGHEFEAEQRITEDPLKTCIHCPAAVKRLISLPGIVFKGSGFYVNDHRSKGSSSSRESSNSSKPAESKPSESKPAAPAKSESKPAENKSGAPVKSSGAKSGSSTPTDSKSS